MIAQKHNLRASYSFIFRGTVFWDVMGIETRMNASLMEIGGNKYNQESDQGLVLKSGGRVGL